MVCRQQEFTSQSPRGWKSQIWGPGSSSMRKWWNHEENLNRGLGKDYWDVCLLVSSQGRKKGLALWPLLIPFMRIPPESPGTPQRPHLLISSHWGLDFNINWIWSGRDTNIQCITSSHKVLLTWLSGSTVFWLKMWTGKPDSLHLSPNFARCVTKWVGWVP